MATSQTNGIGKSEIPITIQEAKDYVEKLKLTQLSTANSFSETGSPRFSLNFNWNNYINENSFRGKNYLVVPIEESQYSWGNKGRVDVYGAFRRDSVGHITGNFYVYVVDSLYFNRVNKKPDSRNFTGELLLYDLQSNFLKGVKLVNGVPDKVITGFNMIDANRGSRVTSRACTSYTLGIWWLEGDYCACFHYRQFRYVICNWEETETWTGLVYSPGNPTIGYPPENQPQPPPPVPIQYVTIMNDLLLIMTGDANYDYFRLRWGMHLSDSDIDKLNNLSIALNLSAPKTAMLAQTHILGRLSDWLANNSSNGNAQNAVFFIDQYFPLLVDSDKSWATMTALENMQVDKFSITELTQISSNNALFQQMSNFLGNSTLPQNIKTVVAKKHLLLLRTNPEYALFNDEEGWPTDLLSVTKAFATSTGDCNCKVITYQVNNFGNVVITSNYQTPVDWFQPFGYVATDEIATIPKEHPNYNFLIEKRYEILDLLSKQSGPNVALKWVYHLKKNSISNPNTFDCKSCTTPAPNTFVPLLVGETYKFGIADDKGTFQASVENRYSKSEQIKLGITGFEFLGVTLIGNENMIAEQRTSYAVRNNVARVIEKILIFNYILNSPQKAAMKAPPRLIETKNGLPIGHAIFR